MKPTFIIEIIREGKCLYIICDDCEMYTTEQIEAATGNTWDVMQKRIRRHGMESKKVLANTNRKMAFFNKARERQRVKADRESYRKWYAENGGVGMKFEDKMIKCPPAATGTYLTNKGCGVNTEKRKSMNNYEAHDKLREFNDKMEQCGLIMPADFLHIPGLEAVHEDNKNKTIVGK